MMLITIDLERPLAVPAQRTARVVLSTVAGVERVRVTGGDRRLLVWGEGVAIAACEAALHEAEIAGASITSSLSQDEAQQLTVAANAAERVRPLGR